MARKFKCRNGTILEERLTELGDEYTCLYDPTREFEKGERVILLLSSPYNKGGALGVGYDIVEELLSKKQKKPVHVEYINVTTFSDKILAGTNYVIQSQEADNLRKELLVDIANELGISYEYVYTTENGVKKETLTFHL